MHQGHTIKPTNTQRFLLFESFAQSGNMSFRPKGQIHVTSKTRDISFREEGQVGDSLWPCSSATLAVLISCKGKLKHPGITAPKRSALVYANGHRPWELYRKVFFALLNQCPIHAAGKKKFRFKNKLVSLVQKKKPGF